MAICGFTTLLAVARDPDDTGHLLSFIFRAVLAVVFIGMNVLYQLFWKNNAKSDYFEAMGIKQLPAEQAEKAEFAPRVNRPHTCVCGYDLRAAPDQWMHLNTEIPPRCPKCEREIDLDEVDLKTHATAPSTEMLQKQAAPATAEISLPLVDTEPAEQAIVEEIQIEDEAPAVARVEAIEKPIEMIGAVV